MDPVTYTLGDSVATIAMDDGKVNALSVPMLAALDRALDRAEADGAAVVVITGRPGIFSAGFDLGTLRSGGDDALAMLRGGFELAHRLLGFPRPIVVACPGHAIAMGLFLAQSSDYRLGAEGTFRITANEVAIGLAFPLPAIEICRLRLTQAAFSRVVLLAEVFDPAAAVTAGILDRAVPAELLPAEASATATALATTLNMEAHAMSKGRARGRALEAIRAAIDADFPKPGR
jgi:enoyl-CoA hydratase